MYLDLYIKVFSVLAFLTAFFGYHLVKYRNPYKLFMVFGKKGSGKSTLMCKLALKYAKKGYTVYSNTYIPGTYQIENSDVGYFHFNHDSVVLIDEVGMVWDNRDYKNFQKPVRNYFKLQRHYKHIVFLFSQSFDVDKKLRDLTDSMYLITNFMNCFSFARRINKLITISHGDKNSTGESKLIDDYRFDPLIFFFVGSVKFTYIPRYVKYFDSYEAPELPKKDFPFNPMKQFPTVRQRVRSLPPAMAGAVRSSCRRVKEKVQKTIKKWSKKG